MGRRLPEVGRPGQDVSILAGDDVDPATGRLLTVAELQQALQVALAVHAQRPRHPVTGVDTPPALLASGEDLAAAAPPVDDEALAGAKKGDVTVFKSEKPVFETALAAAKLLGLA